MGMINKQPTPKEWYDEYNIQDVLDAELISNPKYTCRNLYIFDWESDFLACTRAGYWHEVEIKISLADFKNDFKHKEHKHFLLQYGYELRNKAGRLVYDETEGIRKYEARRPNYFSYCVPYYLADKIQPLLPSYCGLYAVTSYKKLQQLVAPPKLHKEKIADDKLKLKEKFYYAYKNWRERSVWWHKREDEYRQTISFLKAEYKAATGYDISEVM